MWSSWLSLIYDNFSPPCRVLDSRCAPTPGLCVVTKQSIACFVWILSIIQVEAQFPLSLTEVVLLLCLRAISWETQDGLQVHEGSPMLRASSGFPSGEDWDPSAIEMGCWPIDQSVCICICFYVLKLIRQFKFLKLWKTLLFLRSEWCHQRSLIFKLKTQQKQKTTKSGLCLSFGKCKYSSIQVTANHCEAQSQSCFAIEIRIRLTKALSSSGEELECNLKDLRPATDYHVRWVSGSASVTVHIPHLVFPKPVLNATSLMGGVDPKLWLFFPILYT